jgi:nitrile hydratase subunit beta
MSAVEAQFHARYAVGDAVTISACEAIGHCRTPWYVRGKSGIVVEIHGKFRDPERLAYHLPGMPALVLYKVRLKQKDLWPKYNGPASDHLDVDIYEPWLAPADAARGGDNAHTQSA